MNIFLRISLLIIALTCWPSELAAQKICTYYASPTGTGDGQSPVTAFRVSDFWPVAGPGTTLCLLDGTYTSANSMINPPQHLNGTSRNKITITAFNDGQVLLDGAGVFEPLVLENNDYWIIEGINLANSSANVVRLYTGADHNIVRRVVGWNAADINSSIFGIHGNTGNLLEDVAGFGTARKIFQASWGGNDLTIRRAFGMWNRSTWDTPGEEWPSMTYSIAYESYNNTCENCIATQDIDPGHKTGVLYSLLGNDWFPSSTNKCTNSAYVGSIAFTLPTQSNQFLSALYSGQDVDCMRFENVAVHLARALNTTDLQNFTAGSAKSLIFSNVTEIGDGGSHIGEDWKVSNRVKVNAVGSAPSVWNDAGANGARICQQYWNGLQSNIPLWPWPMNRRIIDALISAGRTPIDITATMEQKFGTIPVKCRTDPNAVLPLITSIVMSGGLRDIAESVSLWELSPTDETNSPYDSLVRSGPSGGKWKVMSKPDSEYVAYFWGSNSATPVEFELPSGLYSYTWFDVRDGSLIGGGSATSVNTATIPPPEDSWDPDSGAILVVKFVESSVNLPQLETVKPTYCVGNSWQLFITNGAPNTRIQLLGTSDGKYWTSRDWRRTGSTGSWTETGTFSPGAEGTYTLRVSIDGLVSNAIYYNVLGCPDNQPVFSPFPFSPF